MGDTEICELIVLVENNVLSEKRDAKQFAEECRLNTAGHMKHLVSTGQEHWGEGKGQGEGEKWSVRDR